MKRCANLRFDIHDSLLSKFFLQPAGWFRYRGNSRNRRADLHQPE